MMDLEIRNFQNTIISFCNSSSLPIEVKRLVFVDILKQMEQEAEKVINLEIAERDRKEQEEQHKTIKVDSNGEVVEEDEQGISEPDKLEKLPKRQNPAKRNEFE